MDTVIKFLKVFEDNYPETLKIAFIINKNLMTVSIPENKFREDNNKSYFNNYFQHTTNSK
jgi:hypothetical protein